MPGIEDFQMQFGVFYSGIIHFVMQFASLMVTTLLYFPLEDTGFEKDVSKPSERW